jgi:hypothetical protein
MKIVVKELLKNVKSNSCLENSSQIGRTQTDSCVTVL